VSNSTLARKDGFPADLNYNDLVRFVPEFYGMPHRELVTDAIRRRQAMDCPDRVVELMGKHAEGTDVFVEVGGFLGDCAVF
jgi:hypothetical protein